MHRKGDGNRISFTSVAMLKHHDQGNIYKEEFIWHYGSRGRRVHHGEEAWQQAVGIVTWAGSWEFTPPASRMKQRECTGCSMRILISKSSPGDILLPAKPYLLNLSSMCPSTANKEPRVQIFKPMEGHVLFKPLQRVLTRVVKELSQEN